MNSHKEESKSISLQNLDIYAEDLPAIDFSMENVEKIKNLEIFEQNNILLQRISELEDKNNQLLEQL